jgi:hypothetical protein
MRCGNEKKDTTCEDRYAPTGNDRALHLLTLVRPQATESLSSFKSRDPLAPKHLADRVWALPTKCDEAIYGMRWLSEPERRD